MAVALEAIVVLALLAGVLVGGPVAARRALAGHRRRADRRVPWARSSSVAGGVVEYRVERPGVESQFVGGVGLSDPDLEDRMLSLEVEADKVAEALNRSRRR